MIKLLLISLLQLKTQIHPLNKLLHKLLDQVTLKIYPMMKLTQLPLLLVMLILMMTKQKN
jgi:hypothetical protein